MTEKAPKSATPAKPSERVTGSRTNPKGSASTGSARISLSEDISSSLADKAKAHNAKHKADGKKVTLGMLKAVWRRGAGAFSRSHSPVVQSRQQWAMARVNAFLQLVASGSPRNPKYVTDNDLLPKGHPRRS